MSISYGYTALAYNAASGTSSSPRKPSTNAPPHVKLQQPRSEEDLTRLSTDKKDQLTIRRESSDNVTAPMTRSSSMTPLSTSAPNESSTTHASASAKPSLITPVKSLPTHEKTANAQPSAGPSPLASKTSVEPQPTTSPTLSALSAGAVDSSNVSKRSSTPTPKDAAKQEKPAEPTNESAAPPPKPVSPEPKAAPPVLTIPPGPCKHWTQKRETRQVIYETNLKCPLDALLTTFFGDGEDNDCWHLFYTTDPAMNHKRQKYTRTPWEVSNHSCCLARTMNFNTVGDNLPLIGSMLIPVLQGHRISRMADNQVIYRTRSVASDAPYTDSFVVDTWWYFTGTDASTVNMKVLVELQWVKSCWIKGIIESTSLPTAIESARAVAKIIDTLAKKMPERPSMPLQPINSQETLEECEPLPNRESQAAAASTGLDGPRSKRPSLAEIYANLSPDEKDLMHIHPTASTTPSTIFGIRIPSAIGALVQNLSGQTQTNPMMSVLIGCVIVLVCMIGTLLNRLSAIDSKLSDLQSQMATLGPVVGQVAISVGGGAKEMWESLPREDMARQVHHIVDSYQKTMMLLPEYQKKMHALNVLLGNVQGPNTGDSGYFWLAVAMVVGVIPMAAIKMRLYPFAANQVA